jgi:hypothetical protein
MPGEVSVIMSKIFLKSKEGDNMKYSNAGLNILLFLAVLVAITGCTTMEKRIDDYGNSWISRPLSELRDEMKKPDSYASKINWDENTFDLAKGYYLFIQPFSENCYIYWKINPQNRIVGYFPKGQGCGTVKGTTEPEPELIKKLTPPAKWD